MEANKSQKKRKFEMPHAYVILLIIIVFCTLLTWVLPAGTFERVENAELGRELVVPGSYQQVDASPVGAWGFFMALYEGMVNAGDIIFFVIFASGYVFLLMKTGTLNAMVGSILRTLGKRDYLLIPIFMVVFGIAGSTFGMYEETYGLIPAFIVIAMTLGYDRLVGGGIVFVSVATGFAAATINPFTIGIASSIAGIPLISQKLTLFRIAAFVLFMALSISYVMWYAARIRKDPAKSYVYGEKQHEYKGVLSREEVMKLPFTLQQKITLLGFGALIVIIAYTVGVLGFYLQELSALFIIWMIATGLLNKMSSKEIAEAFVESSSTAIYGVLLIGLSRSIEVIMSQANVIDTAVLYLSNIIQNLPHSVSAIGMLVVQNLINFFIPSGSGQAVVMMPIMAPLSDLIGVSREVAVTAYQFGDGFSNMFWPTAVAVECGIMGVGMDKWYKFITPLFVMMFTLQAILIVIAVMMGI
ncbi:MAG: TIGR00366 family protein [Sedimentibacter sp.]|uniref:YfcC family protein n=1 Tax=Sedimentibacter sp. TaxID=1960295 RepID=UPI0031584DB2